MNTTKGLFIVLEGLDGSGTTTQTKLLEKELSNLGVPVWATAEPVSGSPTGELIRAILRGETEVEPETLALLYAADRNEHLYGRNGIIEHLENGITVICDRYKYSSLAYQSVTCAPKFVKDLNRNFPAPDHFFFLNTPVEECMRRIAERKGTPEIFEKEDFLRTVEKSYKENVPADRTTAEICISCCPGNKHPDYIAHLILNTLAMYSPKTFLNCNRKMLKERLLLQPDREKGYSK